MIRATTLAVLLAASYASFAAEEAKIKPDLAKFQNPKDVHFTAPGYDRLAEQVAKGEPAGA